MREVHHLERKTGTAEHDVVNKKITDY